MIHAAASPGHRAADQFPNLERNTKAMIADDTVATRPLPGGIVYIAVYEEDGFKAATNDAVARGAPGIVSDIRFKRGGGENLAAAWTGLYSTGTAP
ncbi:MAG: hypothetical protein GX882_02285, partial [Methanomicrobiales archaeon]|nr:hypothetical protein [Methanomicrobiales archaeon]